jgi:hypothetical protein
MYGIPAAHDKYKTEWGTLLQDSLTVNRPGNLQTHNLSSFYDNFLTFLRDTDNVIA